MKSTSLLLLISLFTGCKMETDKSAAVWHGEPQQVCSDAEVAQEIAEKMQRVNAFLADENLEAILLTHVRNFYWITAGRANNQIVLNKDIGAATILIRNDGAKFLLCTSAESGRLMEEQLTGLDYELRQFSWFETNHLRDVRDSLLRSIVPKGTIGSDVDFPGAVNVAAKFKRLRYPLTDAELVRYRWVARKTAEAVEQTCRAIQPGMDEYEIEAMTAAALRARGILPTVLLIGVDDRIAKYRHALPGGAVLKKFAMINVVAERWGMPVAMTRFVHFGEMSDELKTKFEKNARINTRYQLATVPGKSCGEIFEACKRWYVDEGYPDEWKKHHQGGAIGYDDREYVIFPGVTETVQARQAFAWNPTITGAKIEDTMIAFADRFEVVTKTGNWPAITIEIDGKKYEQPGVLIR